MTVPQIFIYVVYNFIKEHPSAVLFHTIKQNGRQLLLSFMLLCTLRSEYSARQRKAEFKYCVLHC